MSLQFVVCLYIRPSFLKCPQCVCMCLRLRPRVSEVSKYHVNIRSNSTLQATLIDPYIVMNWSCQVVKTSKPKRASKDTVDLNPTLAGDMEAIIEVILPNASPQMKELIVEQRRQLSAKGPCGHRWSKKLITKCLSLWIRSPQ